MIEINLGDTYTPLFVTDDISVMTFYSPLKKGGSQLITARIVHLGEDILPNVYNLSFGTPLEQGYIDDIARVHHKSVGKVFSTILLFAISFLNKNPRAIIGLDGSDDARAYFYHRVFITNRNYLKKLIIPLGVDWYVRLLRNGYFEMDQNNQPLFKPKTELFDYDKPASDLYRYYMFHLLPGDNEMLRKILAEFY